MALVVQSMSAHALLSAAVSSGSVRNDALRQPSEFAESPQHSCQHSPQQGNEQLLLLKQQVELQPILTTSMHSPEHVPTATAPSNVRSNAPSNALSDEELFALIRDHNDQTAFATLYTRYDRRLYAYCLRATGNHDSAKDAFQAVMSVVFEKREHFTGGSYAAWLFTIARHHVLKLGRNAHRTTSFEEHTETLEHSPHLAESGERDFLLQQSLDRAIARLPDDLREAFELKYRDGLQHEEIADTLGISVSLAKVRVFRAKQHLRTLLASFFDELQ